MRTNYSLSIGTLTGTLFSLLTHVTSVDLIRTAVLAAVGAASSFIVSFILRLIVARMQPRIKEDK